MSESALLMGWVCTRRLMAPARQNPAKRKNRIRCIEAETESAISKPEACSNNVEDGERQQVAPSEVHELVIAETRQSSAHPDVDAQKENYLDYEPEKRSEHVDEGALKIEFTER